MHSVETTNSKTFRFIAETDIREKLFDLAIVKSGNKIPDDESPMEKKWKKYSANLTK